MVIPSAVILQGDARALPLPDNSVDLIVTSPPYFGLRSYRDNGEHYDEQIGAEPSPHAYLDALLDCVRDWVRVLKPSGSMFVNLGDSYSRTGGGGAGSSDGAVGRAGGGPAAKAGRRGAGRPATKAPAGIPEKSLMMLPQRFAIRCIDELGLIVRAEVVWHKPNPMPESVTDRVKRAHEQFWHITIEPRYFSDLDAIREGYSERARRQYARGGLMGAMGNLDHPSKARGSLRPDATAAAWRGNELGKLPDDVWAIASQPLSVPEHLAVEHFAAYPPALVDRIVLGWSPPGGVVLDPFGGTGTTALVASVRGRRGVSLDLSHDYCRIARWRTSDPGERARVLGFERPPVPVEGQLDLLGEGVA